MACGEQTFSQTKNSTNECCGGRESISESGTERDWIRLRQRKQGEKMMRDWVGEVTEARS